MSLERDNQRKRLYDWERAYFPDEWTHSVLVSRGKANPKLGLDECTELVKQVFTDYGYQVPRVTDGRRCRSALWDNGTIKLPRWSRFEVVVLHECAHGIAQYINPSAASHGPLYARVFLDLLTRYLKLPKAELGKSMRAAGLKIDSAQLAVRPSRTNLKRIKEIEARIRAIAVERTTLQELVHTLSRESALLTQELRGLKQRS